MDNIDLFKQSSMTWCCSNDSMPIITSYNPKGKMFRSKLVGKLFMCISQYFTSSETFLSVPVGSCTNHGFSCFNFLSLHVKKTLGETWLQQALG